ncbi:hypothetical protein FQN49_001943 [Arthroderma sp. PD_2]|nr:hypothetical protein FQN49_001943 [Arthroderma sp. PD_2]
MHLNASQILPLLAAFALIEPFVNARTIPGAGGLEDEKQSCGVGPCEVVRDVPGSLHVRVPESPENSGGNPHNQDAPGSHGLWESPPIWNPPGQSHTGPSKPRPKSLNERKPPVTPDDPLPIHEYVEKGKAVRSKLTEAISGKKPDTKEPSVDDYYEVVNKTNQRIELEPQALKGRVGGVEKENTFTTITVQNDIKLFKNPSRLDYQPVHEANYSPGLKLIQIEQIDPSSDHLPDALRSSYSETTFQNWQSVSGKKVMELKWVSHNMIKNKGTQSVIEVARREFNASKNDEYTFHPSSDAKMNDAFNSLSGTDDVRGIYDMLANHHNALGNLEVIGIHTYPSAKYLLIELGSAGAKH